ncbi:redoxin domain-containing protein [Natrononativus amylolyticus]|uniref:redoxin domain-containing protein n=1 Tax=Natrononativus amylolyticus TaxID=2963434 RepID=UPI0020CFB879|nr:redoxin domain-containing protein [Natrononativus amylolyticus]
MPEFDVVDLGPADHPASGDEAPDFVRPLVTADDWTDRSLSSLLEEGATVLVFTPMIGSFVAQYVWDELRERGWGVAGDAGESGVSVAGVTASTPYSISHFLDEREYPFSIFADPANEVAAAYGIAHDLDGMAGVSEPRLAFVAVGGEGAVEAAWVAREWPEFPDYDDLEARLGLA